uniref:Uncharacterized protein n=1 Tax=Romanomermis culicivorax TaxID=13658 RepID=A0A915JS68_ROMCU
METCHEYADVCTTDKHPEFGCRWNTLSVGLKNCADQPHFSDHRRDSLRRFANAMPDMNCFEKDGQCKCCCHPFKPNKEGTECVKIHEEPKCDALGEYNQWSKCLWYPLRNVTQEVRSHCHLGVHTNEVLLPKPTGMELPEPCGHCSFKVRCKTRPRKDGCL